MRRTLFRIRLSATTRQTRSLPTSSISAHGLLRVAINKAKNVTMSFWRRRGVPLEDYAETLAFPSPEAGDLFEKVMKLPEKYRIVIHLFYYEDYSVREIAGILRITEANVKVRLSRGRRLLKEALQEVWTDE